MADGPAPPLFEPHGPLGRDDEVVRAFARDQMAPYSALFHVEGPVLMASRDVPTALRTGPRSFLVNRDLVHDLARAKSITEEVFTAEGMTVLDEDTLFGPAVGVQLVGLRYASWDLWGADIDEAFRDLRLAAAGGEEELAFGAGDPPPSFD